MQKRMLKIALFILIVIAVEFFLGWREFYALFRDFAEGSANPAVFICSMGIGCALGLPVSWCYFFAATAFGIWGGWLCCLAGLFTSACLGFLITKILLPKTALTPLLKRFKLPLDVREATYHANFFIRAIPGVPYFLQNILLADIGTPMKMYLAMTMLVQGPIALAVAFFADSLKHSATANIIVALALIACLTAIHRIMLRVYIKKETSELMPKK